MHTDHVPAVVWLVVGLGLCGAELLTLDLILVMLGGAALVTAGGALALPGIAAQVVLFVGASLVLLGGVRPVAKRHLTSAPALPHGADRLRGRMATVIEQVGPDSGQVRLDGELWRARPMTAGLDAAPGVHVIVSEVQGATLLVYPEELV